MHQFGSDRAVDAAADGTYHPTGFSADFADASDFLPYKFFLRRVLYERTSQNTISYTHIYMYHCPVVFATTNIVYEPGDDLLSPWGVRHLCMKLNAIERLRVVCDGSVGCGCRMPNDMEIGRGRRELVAVRHPHLQTKKKNPQSALGLGQRTSNLRSGQVSFVTSHLHLVAQPFEQGIDGRAIAPKLVDLHARKAVLAVLALCDRASKAPRNFLE